MAATALLAQDDTAAASADVTLDVGAIATLIVFGPGAVQVQSKRAAGYSLAGTISGVSGDSVTYQVNGPVTFRVSRNAGQVVGVDYDLGA